MDRTEMLHVTIFLASSNERIFFALSYSMFTVYKINISVQCPE
jgi:hypothetical protein